MKSFNPNMGRITPPPTTMTRDKKIAKRYRKWDKKFKQYSKRSNVLQKEQDELVKKYKNSILRQNEANAKAHPQFKTIRRAMTDKRGKKTGRLEVVKERVNPTGPTQEQLKQYENGTRYHQALKIVNKKREKAKKLKHKYRKGPEDVIKWHRYNSLKAAKRHMGPNNGAGFSADGTFNDGTNSWIVPNNAQSDDDYIAMQVTEESDEHSTNAASSPIEHGMNVVTTTQMQAPQISITAKISGGRLGHELPKSSHYHENEDMHAVKTKINRLQKWSEQGADVFWEGPHEYSHCIITDVNPTYNWGPDGSLTTADVSMTLTVATYFDTSGKGKHHKGAKGRKRGRKSKAKHKKHYVIAKSGMTYSYIANKKGISVSSLEEKNKYAARKIPVGSKIYY